MEKDNKNKTETVNTINDNNNKKLIDFCCSCEEKEATHVGYLYSFWWGTKTLAHFCKSCYEKNKEKTVHLKILSIVIVVMASIVVLIMFIVMGVTV